MTTAAHGCTIADDLRRAGLVEPGQVLELRALHVSTPSYRKRHTRGGYFEESALDQMVAAALGLEKTAGGIYITLNPLDPDVLARRKNRVDVAESGELATDADVARRRRLLIDADPVRPKGISATNAQKAASHDTVLTVRDFLRGRGWPEMTLADSGNGYHLLPLISLPNDDESRDLVKRVLHALAAKFNTDAVKIDEAVFNAGRITKLYGTVARKGDSTDDRPHRRSKLLKIPDSVQVVPRELLEDLAAEAPEDDRSKSSQSSNGRHEHRLKVDEWLRDRGIEFRPDKLPDGRTRYRIDCPFDPSHKTPDAAIFQDRAGKLGARCFHNSCSGRAWQQFKEAIGRPEARHYDSPLTGGAGGQRPGGGKAAATDGDGHGDAWVHPADAAGDPEPAGGGAAEPGRNVAVAQPNVVESTNDPHRLARVFLQWYAHPDGGRLVYHQEQFHEWDGAAYRVIPPPEIRAHLAAAVKEEFDRVNRAVLTTWSPTPKQPKPPAALPVTKALIGNVSQAMAGYTLLPGTVTPPAWLGGDGPFLADELLPCRNGLVHLPTFAAGRPGFLLPATPRFFCPYALDYPFDPAAAVPEGWLEFLDQLWPDDPESIAALQEWFGYSLLADTSQQKMLMLIGPKRAGKGTIARVLRDTIGPDNVAGPTLASLGTNFGLAPLLGKPLAIISDARLSNRTDSAVVTERLLSISGEDAITVDRKYLSTVTAKLPTRIVLITNELPKLGDASGALAGRFIILRLTRSWFGREDPKLTDHLLAERPGILLWAVAGWRRLQDRGRFVQPAAGQQMVGDLEDLGSPVGAFIRDICIVEPGREVEISEVYERWKKWCESKGIKYSTEQTFGRDLHAAVPQVEVKQPRIPGGRIRVYAGIGVRLDVEAADIPD
jgi:putative DNA primase/helicase